MDSDDMKFIAWTGFGVVLVIALAMGADSYSCRSKWEASGMAVSWGPIQGCLIQPEDGKWIPAENYREI